MNSATPGTTNGGDPPRATRRNGRPQACEPCRAAKVACDRALPTCRKCAKRSMSIHCVYAQRQSNRSTQAKRWAGEDAFRDSLTVRSPHGIPVPYSWQPPNPTTSPYLEGSWSAHPSEHMFPTTESKEPSLGQPMMWQDPGLTNALTPSSSPNSTGTLYNESQMQFCPPLDQPPWMPVTSSALDADVKYHHSRMDPCQQRYPPFDHEQMVARDFPPSSSDMDMGALCKGNVGHAHPRIPFSRDPSGSPHHQPARNYSFSLAPPMDPYASTPAGDGDMAPANLSHCVPNRTYDGMYLKQQPGSGNNSDFYSL